MRNVLYKKWIPREHRPVEGKNYSEPVPGTGCYEPDFIHEGLFHEWGVSCEESDNGYGNSTIALIELPDGTIESVYPFNVKFI